MADTIRRVYVLPTDLHERVKQFCAREEHHSEVDGIRRLLDCALNQFEDEATFEKRMRQTTPLSAAFTACGHPLVSTIECTEMSTVIALRSGHRFTVTA